MEQETQRQQEEQNMGGTPNTAPQPDTNNQENYQQNSGPQMEQPQTGKSIFGLDANLVVLMIWWLPVILNYAFKFGYLNFLIPIAALLLEKESRLVRNHASQALVLSMITLAASVISGVLISAAVLSLSLAMSMLAIVSVFVMVVGLVVLVFTVIASINGFQWKEYRLPLLGKYGDILETKIKN